MRGAIGMGLTWAIGWAGAGIAIGVASRLLPFLPWDWFFKVFDAPLPALAIPGFFGGAFFSAVLSIAGRHRRFEELSLPGFTALGAIGGILLSLFPAALLGLGLLSLADPTASIWPLVAVVAGPFTVLGAASAAGTLLLARKSEERDDAIASRAPAGQLPER